MAPRKERCQGAPWAHGLFLRETGWIAREFFAMSIFDRNERRGGQARPMSDRRGPRQRCRRQLGLEMLEVRLVPASSMWLGTAGADWSTAANWDTPPTAGSDLVFPSSASNLVNTDDLGSMTFGTLTIAGSGYQIGGDSASFTSIDASQTSGSSAVNLPIDLSGPVSVGTGATLVLGGVISGASGLTKNGPGTLDLTAANTYTGTTALTAGTLLVDGNQSGSPVVAASGTTLGGVGTIGSITTAGATLSPGDGAAGILVDAGSLNLGQDTSSNDSTYSVVLDGSSPGNGPNSYSQTQVAGSIALNDAKLNVTLGLDFAPSVPASFTIIDNKGTSPVSGTFNNLPQNAMVVVSGVTFTISYDGGANRDSVVLNEVDPSSISVSSPTSSPTDVTVATASTTTTLTGFPVAPISGQSVTFTAKVSPVSPGAGTPTGTVNFMNGSTPLGTRTLVNGVATYQTATLPVGANSITADYVTDGNFAASDSDAVAVTVAATSNTATSVSYSPAAPVFGQSVTLSASVTPTSATGTIAFYNGTTLLGTGMVSDGTATYDATTLVLGGNTITAVYSGDSNDTSSTSTAVTVTVQQAGSSTAVTYFPTSPVSGQTVTLTATVSAASPGTGTPTGSVEFFNGTDPLGTVNLINGVATLTADTLSSGRTRSWRSMKAIITSSAARRRSSP